MALDPLFLTRPLAHRGLHDQSRKAAENSPQAFRRAIEHGYGIELDVQPSSDGQAMVFHDHLLDRLTDESGLVRGRSADALGRIGLKGGGDHIPTLAEVLTLVAGRAPLLVEIKDQDGTLGPDTGVLERAVAKELANYAGPVAVMSFNPHAVAIMHDLLPKLSVGLVTGSFDSLWWVDVPDERLSELRQIVDFDRTGACFISHDQYLLDAPRVVELRQSGVSVLSWTIRSQAQECDARKLADNITFEGYLPQG